MSAAKSVESIDWFYRECLSEDEIKEALENAATLSLDPLFYEGYQNLYQTGMVNTGECPPYLYSGQVGNETSLRQPYRNQ